jgi:hypothetical protein
MSLTKASFSLINGAPANILDYGADPTGSADSTTAIQAALNASSNVYIPSGTYKTTAALVITGNSKFVWGDGATSIIKPYGAINAIQVGNGTDNVNLGKISSICIQAATTTVLRGIYMRNAREFDLSDIAIFGIDDSNRSFVNQAIFCSFCWRNNFTSIYGLYITGDGIVLGTGIAGTECNAVTFTGCKMNRLTGTGYSGYGAGHTLSGCSAESCTGGGALFQYVAGLSISGGYFEQCGAANIGHTIKIGASQNAGSISGVYIASSGLTNHRAIELDTINGLVVSGVNFTGLTGAGSYGIYTASSVTNVVALANINEAGTPGVLYGGSSYPASFKFDGANLNSGASIGLGSTITKYISTTAALTPSVIPSVPGYVDASIAVTGAAVGDTVTVGGPVTAGLTMVAYVPTGGGAVNIRWLQLSGAAVTPTSGTYRVDVWQH